MENRRTVKVNRQRGEIRYKAYACVCDTQEMYKHTMKISSNSLKICMYRCIIKYKRYWIDTYSGGKRVVPKSRTMASADNVV